MSRQSKIIFSIIPFMVLFVIIGCSEESPTIGQIKEHTEEPVLPFGTDERYDSMEIYHKL